MYKVNSFEREFFYYVKFPLCRIIMEVVKFLVF